jgi:3-isopropylmalate dehydrogenase
MLFKASPARAGSTRALCGFDVLPEVGLLHKVAVVGGDGVGPEVIRQGLDVLADVAGGKFELLEFDLGGQRYLRTGEVLPDSVKESLRDCDAILLGAVGDPAVPPGVLEKGILLRLRFEFEQYINLRPVKLFEGVETPIKGKRPEDIDLVVVRENNEDLYVGVGGITRRGTAEEVAIQTSVNTRAGVERCLRYAFDLARRRAAGRIFAGLGEGERGAGYRGRVTLVAKTNVLTYAHDLWMRAFTEVSRDYSEIQSDYNHVDACCMRLVTAPERYDVIVTTNMFGDIITDLGAVLQGGMGVASSGNLNPERKYPSMFEPVHGSAPDIAGKGVANPVAAILSVAMMLEHLNEAGAAAEVRRAVERVLAVGHPRTPDMGGRATTVDVGRAVRNALGG